MFNIYNTWLSDHPRGEKGMRTIRLIREIIQKDSLVVARVNLGVSPTRFHTLFLSIQGPPHEGFQPVHDNLNRLLGLVFEQFEQWPRVALHTTASNEDREGLKGIGEHVPLAPAISRRGPFRAEDDTSGLRKGQVEGVERMAPEEECSRVKGNALKQILYVDGGTSDRAIRNKVDGLGGRQIKDVKIGDAFLCEEWACDLAALGT
jgi:hypothetical protein